jgi:putative peptide zinc metalloprotease protein
MTINSCPLHRRVLTRIVLVIGLALAVLGALPAAAAAQGDTTAVAVNTKDGSSIFRLAFNVHRVTSEVVDQANAAVAFASCEDCRTVAISIQLILVLSDPDVVTPTNLALAINQDCTSCETLASAYQYVLGVGDPVHFDAEGNQELASIRNALRDLGRDSEAYDLARIQAEVDVLVERLRTVVDEHLVVAGRDGDLAQGVENEQTPQPSPAEETPSPTPSPSETPAAEPSPVDETPSPTSDPSTPTPAPEESSSPSPEPTEKE